MNAPKKVYTNIGVMMKKKADPKNPSATGFYIKLEQQKSKDGKAYGEQVFPITLANGKVLNDGDFISMYKKADKFQKSVEAGKMSQEKADELSKFLLFDLCVVESVDEGGNSDGGDINF